MQQLPESMFEKSEDDASPLHMSVPPPLLSHLEVEDEKQGELMAELRAAKLVGSNVTEGDQLRLARFEAQLSSMQVCASPLN